MPHIVIGPVLQDEPSTQLFQFLDHTAPTRPDAPPMTLVGASSLEEGTHAAICSGYGCMTLVYDDFIPGFEKKHATRLAERIMSQGRAVSLLPLHVALMAHLEPNLILDPCSALSEPHRLQEYITEPIVVRMSPVKAKR